MTRTMTPARLADENTAYRGKGGRSQENRREGFRLPRSIAPPSRTLSSSSSNIFGFIPELRLDYFGELGHLLRGQISRPILRVRIEQQNQVLPDRPVVDDAGAAAFAARPNRYTNLASPPPPLMRAPRLGSAARRD